MNKQWCYTVAGILGCFIVFYLANPVFSDGQFDKYGGWKGLKGEKTGVFHTEEMNGRWWLITPEGNVFWSTGMYSVRVSGIPEAGTGKRPYKEGSLKAHGSEKEWGRVTLNRLKQWGFNTIGDWSSEFLFRNSGLTYVIGLDLPKTAPNVIPEGAYGYFPDVYAPEFKSSVIAQMKNRFQGQPYLLDDPWLLGYFLADEPSWYGSKQNRGALVDDFIRLESGSPGKQAWVNFLKTQYETIGELNLAWPAMYKDFDQLLTETQIKDTEAVKAVKLKFLKEIALRFSKTLKDAIRLFDSHHMILGTRPTRQYPEVIEGIGAHTDIFSMSAYGLNGGYKISGNYDQFMANIYDRTNKPILLGVLIPAQDTHLPYGIVRTQRDRGISYWRYMAEIASDPRIVGAHWFQYFDPPAKCYDAMAANWGLVNDRDEPYTEAVDLIAQANKMVYAYALGLSEFVPHFDNPFGLGGQAISEISQGELKKIALPIENADFENKGRAWSLQTWKGSSKASFDKSVKHQGEYALKVDGGSAEGWDGVGVGVQYNPQFILKPGLEYILSGWIKTENVSDTAFVRIKSSTEKGGRYDYNTEGVNGNQDWVYIEQRFTPKEENKVDYISAQLVGGGVAWFDDVRLEVVAPENLSKEEFLTKKEEKNAELRTKPIFLVNSDFEKGNEHWSFQKWKGEPEINIDEKEFHSGKKSVRINGVSEGWESTGVAVRYPAIELQTEKKYILSGWIKTGDVDGAAFFRIKIKYDDGSTDYFQTKDLGGQGDWEQMKHTFQLRKKGKIEYLAAQLVGRGKAWFDDVSISEVVEE